MGYVCRLWAHLDNKDCSLLSCFYRGACAEFVSRGRLTGHYMCWETEAHQVSWGDPAQCYLYDHSIVNLDTWGGRVRGRELLSRVASVHLLWKSWRMFCAITAFLWNFCFQAGILLQDASGLCWDCLLEVLLQEERVKSTSFKKKIPLIQSMSPLLMVEMLFLPLL